MIDTTSYIILMKLKLPNWGSLYNPNLLMNSDYRSGIINQKGITSLDKSDGSTELGIDGWILYGINIAVGSNYVTFANRTNTTHTIQQPLDIKSLKAGDKVTFYASCFNITGNVYIYMTGLDAQKKKLSNGDNEFTFTLTSALERFYIELAPNAVVSFNCKKLEIGEHFTGMPAWNEVIELLKCYAKYYCFNAQPNINNNKYMLAVQIATNKVRMTIDLPTQINKTPSVKVGYLYIVTISTGAWHLVTSVKSINYVGNKLTLELQTQDNISSSVNNPVYAMFTKDGYLEVDMYDYD